MFVIEINGDEKGFHRYESQSHRTENWMEGYAVVPEELVPSIVDTDGYCDLVVEDGVVVSFTATKRPEEPKAEPTIEEILNAMLGVE